MEACRVVKRRDPHVFSTTATDGIEAVSLVSRSTMYPRKNSGTNLCYTFNRAQDHIAAGIIRLIGESNDLIENRTRDLSEFSIVPHRTTLLRVLHKSVYNCSSNI
jgi:hypothetical protein